MNHKIEIRSLSTYYGWRKIIDNLNMQIAANKITTIVGPSGCGKTTLLMTLAGLSSNYSNFSMEGEIKYDGQVFENRNIHELIGKFGLVFQQPLVFPISIEKNMIFAAKYAGKNKDECEKIATEKLKEVNLWSEVKDDLQMKATKLSGGQQQRLCIARALTIYPDILLLDEPCSALDANNTAIIEKMLSELKNHYTIIFVTHNLAQAKRISDYIAFISDGKLIEYGSKDDVFLKPLEKETREYFDSNIDSDLV